MICPKCGGGGKVFCSMCKGTGLYHEDDLITEQDWLQTANTEQLAEAILQQWIHGAYHGVGEFGLTDKEIERAREDIVEWLKQPYREE